MATYRIGLFADMHYPQHSNSTYQNDLDHLVNTLDSDVVILGGDQVVGESGPTVPHTNDSTIRGFWENVVTPVSNATNKIHAIPGNHEIPLAQWDQISSEYIDEGRLKTPKKLTPVNGLTVLLINTQSTGLVQGGKEGVAENNGRISTRELIWLREEMQAARSRGDVTLVFGHTPINFSTNSNMNSYHQAASATNTDVLWSENGHAYWVVQNWPETWNHISSPPSNRLPAVYFCGHDLQGSANDYRQIGPNPYLYHTFQKHYGSFGPSTFNYIDIDTSTGQVLYKAVSSGTFGETTIMDITPSW